MERLLVLASLAAFVTSGCLDWSALGGNPNDPNHRRPGEGEGEGEGGVEGEGEGGAEGEGEAGPRWTQITAPITAQAELASVRPTQLSSSGGRLFAVGQTHIFELQAEALTAIASLAVPCADETLTGPVALDGTDLLVGTAQGAVRFHANGTCDPPYQMVDSVTAHAVTAFQGGTLIFTGQSLHLVATDGSIVDDHAFDTRTDGAFYADPSGAGIILVRGSPQSAGQAVRVTKPGTELVVEDVTGSAGVVGGSTWGAVFTTTQFGATVVEVDEGDPDGVTGLPHATGSVRVDAADSIQAVAIDDSGELAAVGTAALVAHSNLAASPLEVTVIGGERFGSLSRLVRSPGGEVWAIGATVILHWSAAGASALKDPDIVDRDVLVFDSAPVVAIDGTLFYLDANGQFARADVAGDHLDVSQIVDSVSLQPIYASDYAGRFAFLPAAGGAPARLVQSTTFGLTSYELTADLTAVTATLPASGGPSVSSPTAIAMLDDATKVAYADFSSLYVCAVTLPAGQAPTMTCGSARSIGLSQPRGITVIDPSPGVDDETYVLSGSGQISIMEPGESGRVFSVAVDGTVRPLLLNNCVVALSASGTWNALNQDQPLAVAGRRGFPVADVLQIGDRILAVGGGGQAGQLASLPAPSTATCADAGGAPILDGVAMLNGALRSQADLSAAAFAAGELYALDVDGLLWHVPTP